MAKVFISYSHRDEKARDRLHTHLATLKREKLITAWFDREILAGGQIDHEIASNLRDSDIFLALVSPDFLASKYCYDKEMETALRLHEEGSLRVVPIILEPCDWSPTPLGKLKAVPKDGKPISTWTNENIAYLDVVTELRRLIVTQTRDQSEHGSSARASADSENKRPARRYRVKKQFDSIDRDIFRQQAFGTIEDYFRRSTDELNEIGDPIRARFEKIDDGAFGCTVLNKSGRNKEAYVAVRSGGDGPFGSGITYSYSRHSNSINGFITVEAGEYELYLKSDGFNIQRNRNDGPLSAEEAADALWREFISHAGIEHA